MSPPHTFGLLLFLLLLFLSQPIPSQAIWPLPPKRFKTNALIEAGSLGLDKLQGRIVAFGDFDGNQLYVVFLGLQNPQIIHIEGVNSLDVVSLSDDERTLIVHLWDHGPFETITLQHYLSFLTLRICISLLGLQRRFSIGQLANCHFNAESLM